MATSSKEIILKRIRQALSHPAPLPFPGSEGNKDIFPQATEELDIMFAQEFTRLLGKFAFCTSQEDLINQINQLVIQRKWNKIYCIEPKLNQILNLRFPEFQLIDADVSITSCENLIARTGSIVLSAASSSGRATSVYSPIHICIAYSDQLVYDIKDGLQLIKEKYGADLPSLITFATGPSRTADIEKTLVVGVHGPKEVFVFLVDRDS